MKLLCFLGIHKWSWESKTLAAKVTDVFMGEKPVKIGQNHEYHYRCETCDKFRIKVKGFTCLGDYEHWLT